MIRLLRKIVRLTLLLGHILLGIVLALFIYSPLLRSKFSPDFAPKIVQKWSDRLCRIVHLRVHCHGTIVESPALLVANHISWLDVFAILSQVHVVFVSKQEVARWPFIGWLTSRVGTLFIKRGDIGAADTAAKEIADALIHNQVNVLFFPEGRATDGSNVKRFHARLFQAAVLAKVPVQPIALRYPAGEGLSHIAPYINDDHLVGHVWRLLGEQELTVDLWFCPPLLAEGKPRRELAEYALLQVQQALSQTITNEL